MAISQEMLRRLRGDQVYTEEDLRLRNKYRAIVADVLQKDDFSGICGDVGADWLRENQWFLE